jgi:hypothetical protein
VAISTQLPRAVTVSRRTLRPILTMHGLMCLVDLAELLAAELVSNAVRHTKGPAALRVSGTRRGAGTSRAGPRRPTGPNASVRQPRAPRGAVGRSGLRAGLELGCLKESKLPNFMSELPLFPWNEREGARKPNGLRARRARSPFRRIPVVSSQPAKACRPP